MKQDSASKFSVDKVPNYVEPDVCTIDGLEIRAFENEDHINFYTIWHDVLSDERREALAESEREKQIIGNDITRKTKQYLISTRLLTNEHVDGPSKKKSKTTHSKARASLQRDTLDPNDSIATNEDSHRSKVSTKSTSSSKQKIDHTTSSSPLKKSNANTDTHASLTGTVNTPHASSAPTSASKHSSKSGPASAAAAAANSSITSAAAKSAVTSKTYSRFPFEEVSYVALIERYVSPPPPGSPTLPNGLKILNSSHYGTQQAGRAVIKYKLTKLYNKYRGRNQRREFVHTRQVLSRLAEAYNNCHITPWLAYTALQALRAPESNQLTTVSGGHAKPLIALTPSSQVPTTTASTDASFAHLHNIITPTQNSACQTAPTMRPPSSNQQHTPALNATQTLAGAVAPMPQMHLVYIDQSNLIHYSNRINPQQVAEYRRKSHLLPTSATSKKSSAASYDVYEIMDVLVNSDKTNVSITRNATRPALPGSSVYSHSVNANTPGIVSTQLHLQAKSYVDSMKKFYAEEYERLQEEQEKLDREPSTDEVIAKYIHIEH